MIKKATDMTAKVRHEMRGGTGDVQITDWLNQGEYDGKARLLGTIVLECGSAIGEHVHENEEEIFFVISGEGVYSDNGTMRLLSAGDSCICRAGETHGIRNEQCEPLTLAAVILTL